MLRTLSLDKACNLSSLLERKCRVVANVHLHDLTLREFNLCGCNKLHVFVVEHRSHVDAGRTRLLFRLGGSVVATFLKTLKKLALLLLQIFEREVQLFVALNFDLIFIRLNLFTLFSMFVLKFDSFRLDAFELFSFLLFYVFIFEISTELIA